MKYRVLPGILLGGVEAFAKLGNGATRPWHDAPMIASVLTTLVRTGNLGMWSRSNGGLGLGPAVPEIPVRTMRSR